MSWSSQVKHRISVIPINYCPNCDKVVRANAEVVACDFIFAHIKCENIPSKTYDLAMMSDSGIQLLCNGCCLKSMCPADVFDSIPEEMTCCSHEGFVWYVERS